MACSNDNQLSPHIVIDTSQSFDQFGRSGNNKLSIIDNFADYGFKEG